MNKKISIVLAMELYFVETNWYSVKKIDIWHKMA